MPNVEPVLSVDAITVFEPTATKILFPYAMEYKFVETCEFTLLQPVPLFVDFISFPLLPTEKKRLLPNVIPFNVKPVAPDVREPQGLSPSSDVSIAPSAPQATNVELPNATSLRLPVVTVSQFDPLSVDLKILTFPTVTKTLSPFAIP